MPHGATRVACRRGDRHALTCCALLLLLTGGCAAPGAPQRAARSAEQVPFCETVSADHERGVFPTRFYGTSWGSAVREGAVLGAREGASGPDALSAQISALLPQVERLAGVDVIWRDRDSTRFCMVIDAPLKTVAAAMPEVRAQLKAFGYASRPQRGEGVAFSTDFVFREHASARWMDRFSVRARTWKRTRSVAFVRRHVLISRKQDPYVQAESAGAAEAWILAALRDAVAR